MSIRYRPMKTRDVRGCVEVVAAHPIVAPRYGSALVHLAAVWLGLLESDSLAATAVFEETTGARTRIVGVGSSVFVTDDFVRGLKKPPHFWIGRELVERVKRGESPILTPQRVREANSGDGLNLAVWQACIDIQDAKRAEFWDALVAAFLKYHRGYRLKELVGHGESAEHLLGMRKTGGYLWNAATGRYRLFWEDDLNEIISKPHIAGLTREIALADPGSWIGSLFVYQPPRFSFNRSEQRLLLAALDGGTDQELCEKLEISLDTIKKTWRRIYGRVAECSPEVLVHSSAEDRLRTERGKEKKQRLILYLRDHPEELRPASRRLFQQTAPRR